MINTRHVGLAAALLLASAPLAFAASDGNYNPARQHCSGNADNSINDQYTEHGCHNFTLTISDGGGHEYVGWGIPQTANNEQGLIPPVIPFGTGSSTHAFAFWYDPGPDQGGCVYTTVDFKPQPPTTTQEPCPWFNPAAPNFFGPDPAPNPASGLRLYMGADDNLAGGEHDSSATVDNGPSDGGALVLNLNPASLMTWMGYLMAANAGKLLVHPLPLVDGGIGACADGICFSAQTTRRDQTYPDGTPNYQPVANYSGHTWDPFNCAGDFHTQADENAACSPNTIAQWDSINGDPAVEPGVQIYEDPDAQASPIPPFYPLPAIYVGTCGVIIGGGTLVDQNGNPMSTQPTQFPPMAPAQPGAPYVNDAGQLIIPTGCDQTADDYNTFGPLM
jgi:hypothetical protein